MSSSSAPEEHHVTRPRRTLITLLVVVVVAAVAFGVVDLTHSSTPTVQAGFSCAPQSSFPPLHPGQHGSVEVTDGGYVATFAATAPRTTSETALPYGVPFNGVLTLTHGSKTWVLPKPRRPNYADLDDLCVIQFSRSGPPSVLVEGYSGGAHCCYEPVLYSVDSSNSSSARYQKVIDWSPLNYKSSLKFDNNGGYRPTIAGDQVLLRTEDDAFAYTFGCFACTPMPIRLDALHDGRLLDVTARYPGRVTREATELWRQVQSQVALERRTSAAQRVAPFGVLAAWVADECVVGHGVSAWSQLRQLNDDGLLSNAIYYRDTLIKPKGTFSSSLRQFLLRHGYCAGQLH